MKSSVTDQVNYYLIHIDSRLLIFQDIHILDFVTELNSLLFSDY